MTPSSFLLVVLLATASALCGVGIWALVEFVKTARSLRVLSDDLDARAVPLLEKADVTIDVMNVELLRVDQIVTRIEDITDRVSSTTRTVQGVANAPAEIVTDIADRVRRAWKTRRQTVTGSEQPDSEPDADVTPGPQPEAEEELDDATQDAAVDTAPRESRAGIGEADAL